MRDKTVAYNSYIKGLYIISGHADQKKEKKDREEVHPCLHIGMKGVHLYQIQTDCFWETKDDRLQALYAWNFSTACGEDIITMKEAKEAYCVPVITAQLKCLTRFEPVIGSKWGGS